MKENIGHLMGPVARRILGEPNQRLSTKETLRYGNKGSLSVELAGTWYDHEENEGGGVIDFVKKYVPGIDPWDWLVVEGFIEQKAPKNNVQFVYRDEQGKSYVRKTKFAAGGYMWHHNAKGRWEKGIGPNTRKLPLHLDEVCMSISSGHPIIIVEGEKDAVNVRALGYCATCSPDGAGGINKKTNGAGTPKWYDECSELLTDADVVILNDNDIVGKLHAIATCMGLHGRAKRIRLLDIATLWPEVPHKGDISDWLENGGNKAKLDKAIELANDWFPQYDKVADALREVIQQNPHLLEWWKKDNENKEELNGHTTEQRAAQSSIIMSNAEFIAQYKPPAYLITGLLQRRFVYSMTGMTGSGKTCVALRIAAHVLTGRPINGRKVKKGKVLYFAGENPDDVRVRWIKLCEEMEIDPQEAEMLWLPGVPQLKNKEIQQRISGAVKVHGPIALLIIDTSAAYFQGDDENSNTQLGEHARLMRSFVNLDGGPTVLVTCHPTKNPDQDNLVPRGGGAFLNEMDGNLACSKDNYLITIETHGKFRGPEFSPLLFKLVPCQLNELLDEDNGPIWSVFTMPISEEEHTNMQDVMEQRRDELMQAMLRKPGMSLGDMAQEMGWKTNDGGPNRSLVQRLINKLVLDRLVEKKGGHYTLTKKASASMKPTTTTRAQQEDLL